LSKSGFVMRIRVVQMVFIGLFCLGVSWALCDLAAVYRELIRISPVSVGMMSYGAMGATFMEAVARRLGGVERTEEKRGSMMGALTLILVVVISAAAVIFPYSFVGVQFAQLAGEGRAYLTAESARVAPMSEPYQTLPLILLIVAIAVFAYLIRREQAHAKVERK